MRGAWRRVAVTVFFGRSAPDGMSRRCTTPAADGHQLSARLLRADRVRPEPGFAVLRRGRLPHVLQRERRAGTAHGHDAIHAQHSRPVDGFAGISAPLQGDGFVVCGISVNGNLISVATSTAEFGIADCNSGV